MIAVKAGRVEWLPFSHARKMEGNRGSTSMENTRLSSTFEISGFPRSQLSQWHAEGGSGGQRTYFTQIGLG